MSFGWEVATGLAKRNLIDVFLTNVSCTCRLSALANGIGSEPYA